MVKYLLNVLELVKNRIMEEKDLKKLVNMFNIEKDFNQEEEKVIEVPLKK